MMMSEEQKSEFYKRGLRQLEAKASSITTQIIELQRRKFHLEHFGYKLPVNLEWGIAKALLDPSTINSMRLETLKSNEWLREAYYRGYRERPLTTIVFSDIHPSMVECMDIELLKSEDRLRAAYERGIRDAQAQMMFTTNFIPGHPPYSYWTGPMLMTVPDWSDGGAQTTVPGWNNGTYIPVFVPPPPMQPPTPSAPAFIPSPHFWIPQPCPPPPSMTEWREPEDVTTNSA